MVINLKKELCGTILDIGGGGEGVIGRIYTSQVIAVDNCQAELDDAPGGFEKRLMDADDLCFPDASFDHVTAFYSFLFIEKDLHEQVIWEAVRVLRPGGLLHIWDTNVLTAYPQPFMVELDIDAAGVPIHTTYGVVKNDAAQDSGCFIRLCRKAGLVLVKKEKKHGQFALCFEKTEM